jgi:hypothetical protein
MKSKAVRGYEKVQESFEMLDLKLVQDPACLCKHKTNNGKKTLC